MVRAHESKRKLEHLSIQDRQWAPTNRALDWDSKESDAPPWHAQELTRWPGVKLSFLYGWTTARAIHLISFNLISFYLISFQTLGHLCITIHCYPIYKWSSIGEYNAHRFQKNTLPPSFQCFNCSSFGMFNQAMQHDWVKIPHNFPAHLSFCAVLQTCSLAMDTTPPTFAWFYFLLSDYLIYTRKHGNDNSIMFCIYNDSIWKMQPVRNLPKWWLHKNCKALQWKFLFTAVF